MDLLFSKLSKYTKNVTSTETFNFAGCERHYVKLSHGKRYLGVSVEFDHICNLEITDEFVKFEQEQEDNDGGYHFANNSGHSRIIPVFEYSFFCELTDDFKLEYIDEIIKNNYTHTFLTNPTDENCFMTGSNDSFIMYKNNYQIFCAFEHNLGDWDEYFKFNNKLNNLEKSFNSTGYLIKCE